MNCKKCNRLQAEVDELWRYRKRAEKAEQERDEAKSWASRWQEEAEGNEARGDALAADLAAAVARADTAEQKYEALKVAYNEQGDALVASYAQPRPLAPDAITDEMVRRAQAEMVAQTGRPRSVATIEAVLTAALTEPPARPEGAEDIERVILDYKRENAGRGYSEAEIADRIAEEMNR